MNPTNNITGKLEKEGDWKDVFAPLEGGSFSRDFKEQQSGLGELIALDLSMPKLKIEGLQVTPLTQMRAGQTSQDSLGNKYKCSSCPKSFSTSNGLRFHQRFHKINESTKFNQLENSFTQTRNTEAPSGVTFTEMDINAPISASIIEIKDTNLSNRDLLHIGESQDTLTTEKLHSDERLPQTNERTHSGLKSYKCTTCGKSFSRLGHLNVHERIHTGVKPYKCGECGKSFSRLDILKIHKQIHSGVKPYKCGECGKSFSWLNYLNVHERIHSGVKPYKCLECGRSFCWKNQLVADEQTHTGLKPYKCMTCGKSFSRLGDLNVHKRIHYGVKPYKCEKCGKSFSTRSILTRHERTHTGLKP